MSYDGVIDPASSAALAETALAQTLDALARAALSAAAAADSADTAAGAQEAVAALLAGLGVPHRWTGTALQIRLPDGSYGVAVDLASTVPGPPGATPSLQVGRVYVGDPGWSRQPGSPDAAPVFDLTLPPGTSGWTPRLALVADGTRQVLQIADWTGGAGAKPAAGLYVGAGGLVASAALAVNLVGGGTVNTTGAPNPGDIAVFGADGAHIGSGGALAAFGKTLMALATAAAARQALGLGGLATQDPGAVTVTGGSATLDSLAARTPLGVGSGGTGAGAGGGGALDNVLGISGAAGGGLLTRTGAGSYGFTATATFASSARKVATSGALTGGGDLTADCTLDVAPNGVDNTRLAQMAAGTIKGNNGTGAANAADLTPAQAKALLAIAAGDVSGLGGAATKSVGTTAGTVAAGDDSRFATSAAPSAVNPQALPYASVAADRGKQLVLTGTGALSLPAACQTSGWWCWVKKADGNGQAVITPTVASGTAPTIEGQASICMYQESYIVWWDALSGVFRTAGRPKGLINIGTTTVASGVSSISITLGFADPELRDMHFEYENFTPSATSVPVLTVQKGGSYQTSGYSTTSIAEYGGSSQAGSSTGYLSLGYYVGSGSDYRGDVSVFAFASSAAFMKSSGYTTSNAAMTISVGVHNGASGAITGVAFAFAASGTTFTGTVTQKAFRP